MLIDGKQLAKEIEQDLKRKIEKLKLNLNLAIILVGDDKASEMYVNLKNKKANQIGIKTQIFKFLENENYQKIINKIQELNQDKNINGIMVQLPLPENLKPFEKQIVNTIDPQKDIDGLTSINLGKLWQNQKCLVSATGLAIMKCIEQTKQNLKGKNILIINDSLIIGRPLGALLLNKQATITIAHKFTKNLQSLIKNADIIITAVGQKDFIKSDLVNSRQIIIDAGIVKINNNVFGDISQDIYTKVKFVTPTPGGVGPLTVIMLLSNLFESCKK